MSQVIHIASPKVEWNLSNQDKFWCPKYAVWMNPEIETLCARKYGDTELCKACSLYFPQCLCMQGASARPLGQRPGWLSEAASSEVCATRQTDWCDAELCRHSLGPAVHWTPDCRAGAGVQRLLRYNSTHLCTFTSEKILWSFCFPVCKVCMNTGKHEHG